MRSLSLLLALFGAVTMAAHHGHVHDVHDVHDRAANSLREVSASAEQFSTSFFKEVSKIKPNNNLVSSPLSADLVLSMAAYGAGGETAKQMHQALSLPKNDLEARRGFKSLLEKLNNVKEVTLGLGNKMYLDKDMEFKNNYMSLTKDYFHSEVSEFDGSQPTKAVEDINQWIKEQTHGKINEIVEKKDFDDKPKMVLVNTIYFKGNWATPFNAQKTEKKTFYLNKNDQKEVSTMFVSGYFPHGKLPDLKAKFIELPYSNRNLKMVIVVPDEIDGLNYVINNLESFNQTTLTKERNYNKVELRMPKFKIESEIDLKEPLLKMGMTEMFENSADFSGIAQKPLKVSKVLQKAFIDVNEEGSEATAATAIQMGVGSAFNPARPELFTVDRPFYFAIKYEDADVNVVLFQGAVMNP